MRKRVWMDSDVATQELLVNNHPSIAQKGGTRSKGEDRSNCKGRQGTRQMGHVCVKIARADRGQVTNSRFSGEHGNRGCFVCLLFSLV
jgi:hypothetical protein